jgi:hypothetical protein
MPLLQYSERGKMNIFATFQFLLIMGLTADATGQCPTYEAFFNTARDWPESISILPLIDIADDLPGWVLFLDGDYVPIYRGPRVTSLGAIVDGEDLAFTIRHY